LICLFNFLLFFCSVFEYIHCNKYQILTNSNQQTQSYEFTSHIAAFLSVVLITEMLEICIQISYDQNVQLILKSYLPVMYGTPLKQSCLRHLIYMAPKTLFCLTFQSFDCERTWWLLFQKCVVCTKLNSYVFY
jgi:hypothetical protein